MWPGLASKAGLVLDGGLRNHLTATGSVLGLVPPAAATGPPPPGSTKGAAPTRQGLAAPWDIPAAACVGGANKLGLSAPWDAPAATASVAVASSSSSTRLGLSAPWDAQPASVTAACGSPSSSAGEYRLLAACSLPMKGTQLVLLALRGGGGGGAASSSLSASGAATAVDVASVMPCLGSLRLEGPAARDGLGERAGSLLRPEGLAFDDLPASLEQVDYVGAELPRVYYSSEWGP